MAWRVSAGTRPAPRLEVGDALSAGGSAFGRILSSLRQSDSRVGAKAKFGPLFTDAVKENPRPCRLTGYPQIQGATVTVHTRPCRAAGPIRELVVCHRGSIPNLSLTRGLHGGIQGWTATD